MYTDCFAPTKKYIFAQFNAISQKYGETLLYARSRDQVHLDLFNLYNDIKIFWGKNFARKLFKECLIEYCGPTSGVAVFRELFEKGV